MVEVLLNNEHIARFNQDGDRYLLEYQSPDIDKSITLSLPNTKKFYFWEHRFPPFFETFIPEGYLYEVFKNIVTKRFGYIDDYLMFRMLSPNIESRVTYKSDYRKLDYSPFDSKEILENDTPDLFNRLLTTFLNKNAISGVQPKTIALVKDKESLTLKEYIIKTWGTEFPHLAENEYFCLNALKKAGVNIPRIKLSRHKRFLIVENFTIRNGKPLGFEEVLSLSGKNRINKYLGSYEQVSRIILKFSTEKAQSMHQFYKSIIMSHLLKNGDAHLKNFGLLFNEDFSRITLAPSYDVVTTTAYIYKDRPALSINGKKIWHSKKTLLDFGQKNCLLSKREALSGYNDCINALTESIKELKIYIKDNPGFKRTGQRMIDSWKVSLSGTDMEELGDGIIGTWQ